MLKYLMNGYAKAKVIQLILEYELIYFKNNNFFKWRETKQKRVLLLLGNFIKYKIKKTDRKIILANPTGSSKLIIFRNCQKRYNTRKKNFLKTA